MRSFRICTAALFFIFTGVFFGQNYSQKSVSVTVYNANLGVIKDVREINLKEGTSNIAITDVAQQIDPTSVHIKFDGDVLEQNYQYDLVSLDKILQKYVDHNIQLIDDKGELVEGTLLSSFGGQIVLKKNDGGLLMLPNIGDYRISVGSLPDGLITRPTLLWMVDSNKSGSQDVEVSYQTKGMSWHAEYVAVLNNDDSKIDLNAWVSIENKSGAAYKNAKLKLVAGDVNLVKEQPRNVRQYAMDLQKESAPAQFQENAFFEYHIYNLQRNTTLAQNETKQISLFEANDVAVTKKYFYGSGTNYYPSSNNSDKVSVIVEFENKKDNNMGMPMPRGKVRVYKSDGGSVEFIGEDMIDHTPKDEKVKLKIGDAFDITANETQTDYKKISNKVHEQEFEITFNNHKKDDVVIEVERYLGLNWEVLSSNIDFKKRDAQNIVFQVPVKADDETSLKFRIRYSY